MGCVRSDGEDELRGSSRISKRFEISKKFSDDCITSVDYASVPRKLRSAIKKRTNEFISRHFWIPEKKPNHLNEVFELPRKNGLKKFKKQHISGGSVSEVVVDPITKDEEEVAETLYALAGMFPETVTKNKIPLEGELSETKSTAFADSDSSRPRVGAIQEEAGFDGVNVEAPNHSSNFGGSAEEGVRIQSVDDVSQPEKYLRRKLSMELHIQGSKSNLTSTVLNSEAELGIQRPPCITLFSCDLSSTSKGSRSNIHQPELSLANGRNSDQVFKLADIIGGRDKVLYPAFENKSNGSVCSGLSLRETCDSDMQGPSLQSSTSKFQTIFPNKSCFWQPPNLENSVTAEKHALVQVDSNKSCKRCCTHVHISHLIKGLQKTQSADILQMQSTQLTTREGLNRGALITSNNFTDRSDNLHRTASTKSDASNAAERNSSEVRSAVLLHKMLLQNQQARETSILYAMQKQNLEFFPLPGVGARGEITHGAARADTSVGAMAQLHIPYQKSRNQLDRPFLLRQNCYSSSPSISHQGPATAAQQALLPPYHGSSSYASPLVGVTASSKQQVWQQQQHRNNQLAAHCKHGHVTAPNVENWKNKVQNSPSLLYHSQPFFPPIHSSTEVLGSYYTPQQQQSFTSISLSLPPSRAQDQNHQTPYGYQGNGGGHHPKSVKPLQLL